MRKRNVCFEINQQQSMGMGDGKDVAAVAMIMLMVVLKLRAGTHKVNAASKHRFMIMSHCISAHTTTTTTKKMTKFSS